MKPYQQPAEPGRAEPVPKGPNPVRTNIPYVHMRRCGPPDYDIQNGGLRRNTPRAVDLKRAARRGRRL